MVHCATRTLFNGLAAHSPGQELPTRGVMDTVQQEVQGHQRGTEQREGQGRLEHRKTGHGYHGHSETGGSKLSVAQNNRKCQGYIVKRALGVKKNRGSGAQTKRRVRDAWGTEKQ